ncbi:MAG: hypothetical protein P8048_13680 [Calditrichia bacterium]
MMQKLSWYVIFFVMVILSCNQTDNKVLQEIQQKEYLSDPNPEKFVVWLNSPDEEIREKPQGPWRSGFCPGTDI